MRYLFILMTIFTSLIANVSMAITYTPSSQSIDDLLNSVSGIANEHSKTQQHVNQLTETVLHNGMNANKHLPGKFTKELKSTQDPKALATISSSKANIAQLSKDAAKTPMIARAMSTPASMQGFSVTTYGIQDP